MKKKSIVFTSKRGWIEPPPLSKLRVKNTPIKSKVKVGGKSKQSNAVIKSNKGNTN